MTFPVQKIYVSGLTDEYKLNSFTSYHKLEIIAELPDGTPYASFTFYCQAYKFGDLAPYHAFSSAKSSLFLLATKDGILIFIGNPYASLAIQKYGTDEGGIPIHCYTNAINAGGIYSRVYYLGKPLIPEITSVKVDSKVLPGADVTIPLNYIPDGWKAGTNLLLSWYGVYEKTTIKDINYTDKYIVADIANAYYNGVVLDSAPIYGAGELLHGKTFNLAFNPYTLEPNYEVKLSCLGGVGSDFCGMLPKFSNPIFASLEDSLAISQKAFPDYSAFPNGRAQSSPKIYSSNTQITASSFYRGDIFHLRTLDYLAVDIDFRSLSSLYTKVAESHRAFSSSVFLHDSKNFFGMIPFYRAAGSYICVAPATKAVGF